MPSGVEFHTDHYSLYDRPDPRWHIQLKTRKFRDLQLLIHTTWIADGKNQGSFSRSLRCFIMPAEYGRHRPIRS